MSITISARKNGPFIVEGDLSQLTILDTEGNPQPVSPVQMGGKSLIFLCRCGGSETKPFCDGTHSKIGFQAAESAVRKADQG
jgi:3-phenylpropionate/trans-cinnamate dioxygenase ferredoxin subunit